MLHPIVPVHTVADALAFEDLVPSWRGRLVRDAQPLDLGGIRQIGILIADEQQGPFALELAAIEAWRVDEPDEAAAGTRAAAA